MNKILTIKKLALATAISGLCMSQSALADYALQTIELDQNSFGSFDMDAGKVIKIDASATGYAIVLVDGENETVIKDSASIKSDVGLTDGQLYWTEYTWDPIAEEGSDELFTAKDGVVTQLTSNGTSKEGFTFDEGKVVWVERVDGHNQLMMSDGINVSQLTSLPTDVYIGGGSQKSLRMADGQVVMNAYTNGENAAYLYDGVSTQRISQVGMDISWPHLDNGVVVWSGRDSNGFDEVYKWEDGVITQLTFDEDTGYRQKIDPQISEGVISWKVLTDQTRQNAELYIMKNGSTTMLSDSVQGSTPVMDAGKIVWTEGTSGTPSSIHEYVSGVSEQIHAGANPIGLDIDGNFISWREGMYPVDPYLTVASLIVSSDPVRVEAEDFSAQSGIQTESTSDTGGGLNIGWVDAGDWLSYNVDIPASESGEYEVSYRVASAQSTGAIRFEVDGVELDSFAVSNTGGWQNWETITRTVSIPSSGSQSVTIAANSGPWNLNWFEIKAVEGSTEEPSTDPIHIEAESFDNMSGVQTENTSDVGGGLNVGYLDAGDWMTFPSVNVPTTGTYTLELRVASNGGNGSLSFERAGGSQTYATVAMPNTNGWQNWTTVSVTVDLEAGEQSFGMGINQGGFNINWFKLTPQ